MRHRVLFLKRFFIVLLTPLLMAYCQPHIKRDFEDWGKAFSGVSTYYHNSNTASAWKRPFLYAFSPLVIAGAVVAGPAFLTMDFLQSAPVLELMFCEQP
jgi:hypothetical protein